jgi:hypothetical protein
MTHQQSILIELEQKRLAKTGAAMKTQSMMTKTPSQSSSKTNSSRNSFHVLAYNSEDEDYYDVNNDEFDMYTFDVNTLINNITMEKII